MLQRDETIEGGKRLDALFEYAIMYGDDAETACLRACQKRIAAKLEERLSLCERRK